VQELVRRQPGAGGAGWRRSSTCSPGLAAAHRWALRQPPILRRPRGSGRLLGVGLVVIALGCALSALDYTWTPWGKYRQRLVQLRDMSACYCCG
jgi:hypothetical protein